MTETGLASSGVNGCGLGDPAVGVVAHRGRCPGAGSCRAKSDATQAVGGHRQRHWRMFISWFFNVKEVKGSRFAIVPIGLAGSLSRTRGGRC